MSQLTQYARLASVLQEMEKDLGLQDMSVAEKAILSALTNLHQGEKGNAFIASKRIRAHDLCKDLPNPTFFRALSTLVKQGYLTLPDGRAKGLYRISGVI